MDTSSLLQPYFLLLARLTPLFMAMNGSPMQYFPLMVRLVLLFSISLILAFGVTGIGDNWLTMSIGVFVINLLFEFVLGMAILLGFQLAIAAIQMMGRVLDMQIGFAAAGVMDPHTNNNEPLLGHIIVLLVTLCLFLSNTHHHLLLAFREMLALIPPGRWDGVVDVSKIMSYFSVQLSFALLLIGPVVMGLWLMDLFSGIVSKTMPQMNVYFVTLPLKIWLGMYLLSLSVEHFKPLLGTIFNTMDKWFEGNWLLLGVVR
ncbi:flagellar biosynthetic protein FliR [Paraneptunicella aestuarii]|uniref:flagellar biosynthetic protein FliR n=1 Tax=Paraneptunicella aestuarii TaxID=2831148 RepID=UPI001E2C954B|nr:flagellar biosynthetic protein FliR [Paraneptunicella aestuarii]UAA37603.1 flagellar biosynthetic protein FliR [Paraneptunicella aestuarii]